MSWIKALSIWFRTCLCNIFQTWGIVCIVCLCYGSLQHPCCGLVIWSRGELAWESSLHHCVAKVSAWGRLVDFSACRWARLWVQTQVNLFPSVAPWVEQPSNLSKATVLEVSPLSCFCWFPSFSLRCSVFRSTSYAHVRERLLWCLFWLVDMELFARRQVEISWWSYERWNSTTISLKSLCWHFGFRLSWVSSERRFKLHITPEYSCVWFESRIKYSRKNKEEPIWRMSHDQPFEACRC